MPARALVDAWRQPLVFGDFRRRDQDEPAITVTAFGDARLTQLQPHARVAERAADAVAGDAARGDRDDFGLGLRSGHGGVVFRTSGA